MDTSAPSAASRPGLRERKKQRTADAIRHAATQLFRDKGYEATTVEEIADAAEVSASTFFRYFPTKEAVLLRTSEGAAVIRRGLAERPDDEPLWSTLSRALVEGLPSVIDYPADELERIRIAYTTPSARGAIAAAMADMKHEIAAMIRPLVGRGKQADLRANVLAGALCAAIEVTEDIFLASGSKGDPMALLANAREMYGAGLEQLSMASGRTR